MSLWRSLMGTVLAFFGRKPGEVSTDHPQGGPSREASHVAKPALTYREVATTPALHDIHENEIVHVVYGGEPLWIMFQCPCRQGHVVSLPAATGRSPKWELTVRDGRTSMTPSVYQRDRCFSHYWIKDGQIRWCANSGIAPWIAEPKFYAPPQG